MRSITILLITCSIVAITSNVAAKWTLIQQKDTSSKLYIALNQEVNLSESAKNIIIDLKILWHDLGVAWKIIINSFIVWVETKYDNLTPEKQQKVDNFVAKLKDLFKKWKLKVRDLKEKIKDFFDEIQEKQSV